MTTLQTVAFEMPGGEEPVIPRQRPVDLGHLAQQTMGDRALELEVLGMFSCQVGSAAERMRAASHQERKTLAHTLKGSARSIGAFRLASIAQDIEKAPGDGDIISALETESDQVRDFIATICR